MLHSYKRSIEIFEQYRNKQAVNGYFGVKLWDYETNMFKIECWDCVEGQIIVQIFKLASGIIIYKPLKVKYYEQQQMDENKNSR